jgi:hypothetical protein
MDIVARLAADETLGDRIMKVNHAGENGAVNIYRAQVLASCWRKSDLKSDLRQFLEHEKRHRAVFATELTRRGRRRCRSYWICGVGGFALGLVQWKDECLSCHPQLNDRANWTGICTTAKENRGNPKKISS